MFNYYLSFRTVCGTRSETKLKTISVSQKRRVAQQPLKSRSKTVCLKPNTAPYIQTKQ